MKSLAGLIFEFLSPMITPIKYVFNGTYMGIMTALKYLQDVYTNLWTYVQIGMYVIGDWFGSQLDGLVYATSSYHIEQITSHIQEHPVYTMIADVIQLTNGIYPWTYFVGVNVALMLTTIAAVGFTAIMYVVLKFWGSR